jgi:hypothetical protein
MLREGFLAYACELSKSGQQNGVLDGSGSKEARGEVKKRTHKKNHWQKVRKKNGKERKG